MSWVACCSKKPLSDQQYIGGCHGWPAYAEHYLSQTSSNLVAIVSGVCMMSMRQIPVGKAAGLVVGLGLQEMASLLSSH